MILASECVNHCSLVDSYTGLLSDAPHVLFELTLEALTGLALYPLLRRARRHFASRLHREIDVEHGVEHVQVSPNLRLAGRTGDGHVRLIYDDEKWVA